MKHVPKISDVAVDLGNRGVAAIEYALVASLIALSIIVGIANLGGAVGSQFNEVDSGVSSAGTRFQH